LLGHNVERDAPPGLREDSGHKVLQVGEHLVERHLALGVEDTVHDDVVEVRKVTVSFEDVQLVVGDDGELPPRQLQEARRQIQACVGDVATTVLPDVFVEVRGPAPEVEDGHDLPGRGAK
jgi:hypothetical protein